MVRRCCWCTVNNRDQLPGHNRSQFEKLVCEEGLGYCCPYALFRVVKATGAIATRLGMTDRTVRLWKARFKSGELTCQKEEKCLLPYIRSIGK